MTRAKIQFNDDASGKEAWDIIKIIQETYYEDDSKELEKKEQQIREDYPNAVVKLTAKKMSAPEVVLELLRNELNRLGKSL